LTATDAAPQAILKGSTLMPKTESDTGRKYVLPKRHTSNSGVNQIGKNTVVDLSTRVIGASACQPLYRSTIGASYTSLASRQLGKDLEA